MSFHRAYRVTGFAILLFLTTITFAKASGWKLVFEDNFSGKELDRTKWATRYIYGGETLDRLNDELQRYRDNNNHLVNDGIIELVAKQNGKDSFESGMLRSRQTFYYGYFEARVFLPKGRGVWPAFWLNSDYDKDGGLGWPPEIDIFEYAVNGKEDTENMVHSAGKLSKGMTYNLEFWDSKYNSRWKSYINDVSLNEAWHVFGLVWAPEKFTVFLDGKPLYTQSYQWMNNSGTLAAPAHILMNFAIGGSWAGRHGIEESNFPQSLKIDYVRACQFDKTSNGVNLCGGSEFTPSPRLYGYNSSIDDLPKPVFHSLILNSSLHDAPAPVGEFELPSGSTFSTISDIALPEGSADRTLSFNLVNRATPYQTIRLEASSTINFHSNKQSLDFQIPPNAPPGNYLLMASLSTLEVGKSKRVPVRCDSAIDKTIKALSCNMAKIKITR